MTPPQPPASTPGRFPGPAAAECVIGLVMVVFSAWRAMNTARFELILPTCLLFIGWGLYLLRAGTAVLFASKRAGSDGKAPYPRDKWLWLGIPAAGAAVLVVVWFSKIEAYREQAALATGVRERTNGTLMQLIGTGAIAVAAIWLYFNAERMRASGARRAREQAASSPDPVAAQSPADEDGRVPTSGEQDREAINAGLQRMRRGVRIGFAGRAAAVGVFLLVGAGLFAMNGGLGVASSSVVVSTVIALILIGVAAFVVMRLRDTRLTRQDIIIYIVTVVAMVGLLAVIL